MNSLTKMGLLTLLAITFFMRLGYWQLHRASEKEHMLTAQARLSQHIPTVWRPTTPLPKQYQRIQVSGQMLPQIILLDNQYNDHHWGYDVLSPLLLRNGRVILVDRGWVPGDPARQSFPTLELLHGDRILSGSVYYPSKKYWSLGQAIETKSTHLAIIERLDPHLFGQFLHKSVYPFIIRLDAGERQGFVRHWAVVSMPPVRHYAYAVQWFAIALVCLILFIALNIKKKI